MTKMNPSASLDSWRDYFRGGDSDIFAIIDHAIMVAAADWPNEFESRRDRIAELLFSCRVSRSIVCDHLELSVAGDEETNHGRRTVERVIVGSDRDGSGVATDAAEDETKSNKNQTSSDRTYRKAEALIDELGQETFGIVDKVMRIKDILSNKDDEVCFDCNATGVTSSTKASSTNVPCTFKKPIGAMRAGKTGGLGAQKLTTKGNMFPQGNLYGQKPDNLIPASSSTINCGSKSLPGSSFASRFEYTDHLLSQGQSGAGTQVLSHVATPPSSSPWNVQAVDESYEARKKFPTAKSISSGQFFGDENISYNSPSKTTLDEVKKGVWSSVGIIKEKVAEALVGADVYGIRRRVTELMQIMHSKEADYIPLATRREMVHAVCEQITNTSIPVVFFPIFAPMLYSAREDAWDLLRELCPVDRLDP